jgi:hypothetical protein
MLYSLNGQFPQRLPTRIRLSDNSTLTSEAVVTWALQNSYVEVEERPEETEDTAYEWENGEWTAKLKPLQPFPSWIRDTETNLWIPPVSRPEGGGPNLSFNYHWDESTTSWVRKDNL